MNPALIIVSVVVLLVIVALIRQRAPFAEAGETLLLGPQYGSYFKILGGIISLKTVAIFALTDRRVIIRLLLLKDIEIPLSQIQEVTEKLWYKGNFRDLKNFVVLKMKDDRETAFMVKDPARWRQEITARLLQS